MDKRFAWVFGLGLAIGSAGGGYGTYCACNQAAAPDAPKNAACQCGDKCDCCQCGKPAAVEAGPLRDGFRHWRTASALHTTIVRLEVEGKLTPDQAAACKLIRTDAKAFAALHAKVNQAGLAEGYVEANGDFLKWLLTAFWNNRDQILAFIMEIVKIFRGLSFQLMLMMAGYC